MTIDIRCACGRLLRPADELEGLRVKCPMCGRSMVVARGASADRVTSTAPKAPPPRSQHASVGAVRPATNAPASRSSTIWLLVLIPIGLLGLCAAGGVGVVIAMGSYFRSVSQPMMVQTSTVRQSTGKQPVLGAPPFPPAPHRPVEGARGAGPIVTPTIKNPNELLKRYQSRVTLSASSTYNGYSTSSLIDGDLRTSWFSAQGDSVGRGGSPWIDVGFPENVTVRQATILGNRDATWPTGYSVLSGRLSLLDASGKVLKTVDADGAGELRDFDFRFDQPIERVRTVRFTSMKDEGNQNGSGDIAIGEVQID